MPFRLAVLAAILAGPAWAGGPPGDGPGWRRHPPARALPPEVRYRDRRVPPPPRLGPHFGPPVDVIQAYLPRPSNLPMYNEPPSRFPPR